MGLTMGFLQKIFGRNKPNNIIDSVGGLAKDLRTAITGDIPPEKRAELLDKTLQITLSIVQTQANVITTEASGSILQRSWRPITALTFLILIVLAALNIIDLSMMKVPEPMWKLLMISMGGYIGGRTIEKSVALLKK